MKRSTAIGHLVETGEVSSGQLRFRGTDIGWPVEELWVTGDLLGLGDTVDGGSVVVVLDVPPDEAPWLAINHAGEWAGDQLRLRKRPLLWCYRPIGWPVWNHQHRRLVRYWSAGAGLDDTVIDALWRRENKGYDESPENHLWRAAAAVSEMQDALDELEP